MTPNKLTPALQKRLVKHLKAGHYRGTAATLAGISPRTLQLWAKEQGEPFASLFAAIEHAEAQAIDDRVKTVSKAMKKSWQAATWWLERHRPAEYSGRAKATVADELESMMRALRQELDEATWEKVIHAVASEPRGLGAIQPASGEAH